MGKLAYPPHVIKNDKPLKFPYLVIMICVKL